MTVVRRILLGYVGLMVLVLALVVVGVTQLMPLQSGIKEYSDSTRAQVEAAGTIAESASNMESAVLISVVTYDQATREAQGTRLEEEATAAREALDTLSALAVDGSEQQATVDSLAALLDQYYQAASEDITLAETKTAEALNMVRENVIPMSAQLREATESFKASASAYEAAEADRLAGNAGRMWLIMLIMAAVVVAGGIAFAVTISQTIRRQLREAVADIDRSAAELLAISTQVSAGAAETAASTNETTATV
ncbi:MAG: hypothetical protein GXY55_03840, partial [Phycisphaerae bacterium]|nr:hypothetical protein [Phycisphaerae bacterium]